jgi:hypothetical protein
LHALEIRKRGVPGAREILLCRNNPEEFRTISRESSGNSRSPDLDCPHGRVEVKVGLSLVTLRYYKSATCELHETTARALGCLDDPFWR